MNEVAAALLASLGLSCLFYALLRYSSFRFDESRALILSLICLSLLPLLPLALFSEELQHALDLSWWQAALHESHAAETGAYVSSNSVQTTSTWYLYLEKAKATVAFWLSTFLEKSAMPMVITALILALWGLGRFVYSHLSMQAWLRSLPLADKQLFLEKQKQLLRKHKVCVLQSNKATAPFVYGRSQAKLVLPNFIYKLSREQQLLLIDHELVHIQRKDHQQLWYLRLLVSLLSYNPILRLFERAFMEAIELSCDRGVLNRHQQKQHTYSLALLECLKLSSEPLHRAVYAGFSDRKRGRAFNKKRFLHINDAPRHGHKLGRIVFVITALSMSLFANIGLASNTTALPNLQAWQPPIKKQPIQAYRVSSQFGVKQKIRNAKPHRGIDLAAKTGTAIVSANAGIVRIADDSSLHKSLGLAVLVEHEQGFSSLYSHMDSIAVDAGQLVLAGEQLGTVGSSGKSTGPHLHFELRRGEQALDPNTYIDF
ncbi:M23/M56 family metallopeptidase [Agaribacterium sp. ZY112]|uniref:M23/M56 family metallopeptidase n=1 Tax=Agaribacterium sp. ZY112 TaxID=3233574 RepID=UPI0035233951